MFKLSKIDQHLFLEHLLRLEPTARYLRFKGHVHDEIIKTYVDDAFQNNRSAVFACSENQSVIGACHVVFVNEMAVDISLSVEFPYRGKGYGKKLFSRAIEWARNRGATEIMIECFAENRIMLSLAKKHSAEIHQELNEIDAKICVDKPNLFDFWIELQRLPFEEYEHLSISDNIFLPNFWKERMERETRDLHEAVRNALVDQQPRKFRRK